MSDDNVRHEGRPIMKKAIALLVAAMLLTGLSACGGSTTADAPAKSDGTSKTETNKEEPKPQPADLTGTWKQTNSNDPSSYMEATISGDTIEIDFSARVVVGRKIPAIYQQRHNEQPREFYADLMSHLLKYSGKIDPLILDVAERGSSTSNLNLQHAVDIAQQRSRRGTVTHELRNTTKFNVQPYDHEILLALADYSLWTVQRVYEKGDEKFFGLLEPKIVLVHDVYDSSRYFKSKNYYRPKYNPLTRASINFDGWAQPEW